MMSYNGGSKNLPHFMGGGNFFRKPYTPIPRTRNCIDPPNFQVMQGELNPLVSLILELKHGGGKRVLCPLDQETKN